MASNRHLGRIIALQTLYEQELRQEARDTNLNLTEVLERNTKRYKEMLNDVAFVKQLVIGVNKQAAQLDAKLQPVAPEWPIEQIARMDRIILRMGLYELENEVDVPPKVVINEAVELAKAFGGDNSSKFINGVLGTLLRAREESSPQTAAKSPSKPRATSAKTKSAASKKQSTKKGKQS